MTKEREKKEGFQDNDNKRPVGSWAGGWLVGLVGAGDLAELSVWVLVTNAVVSIAGSSRSTQSPESIVMEV